MQTTTPPTSLGELKARLLALNTNPDLPFKIKEDGEKIVASWNIVDAKWIELFGKAGMKEYFELHLAFDETTHSVTYLEKSGSVQWTAGLPQVSFEANKFVGKSVSFQKSSAYGMKEDGSLGQIYNFDFSTAKITGPVFDTITHAGWKVDQTTFGISPKTIVIIVAVISLIVGLILAAQVALYFSLTN